MTQKTVGELIVLALLALSLSRIFYLRKVKRDVLSTLPLVALGLSVLNVFAWGLSATETAVCLLSLFVTIWNVRAMLRLATRLVIDHYSGLFIFISVVNLVLTVALAAVILLFRPAPASLEQFGVVRTDSVYTGSFATGFDLRIMPFDHPAARLSVFSPADSAEKTRFGNPTNAAVLPQLTGLEEEHGSAEKRKVIVFVPGKMASTDLYQPTLVKLAHDGYTVYCAEFYAPDMRWFDQWWKNTHVARRLAFVQDALGERQFDPAEHAQDFCAEYRAVLSMAAPSADDTVVVAADCDEAHALSLLRMQFPSIVDATFDFGDVADYKTRGFGPIEQTDPLFARVQFGLERDGTLFAASHIATALERAVSPMD